MIDKFSHHNHRRNRDFVMELPDLKDQHHLSPSEIAAILDNPHEILDAGNNGMRVGKMTIRDFLEKFG